MSTALEELLVTLGIDTSAYDTGLDNAATHTTSVADGVNMALGGVVVDAAAAAGEAVAGFAVASVDAAGTFEAGMLSFASVTGSSITDAGLSLDDFQGKFLQLGAETSFSAAQAQDAAIELAKGGVSVTSIMNDATSATLDLASAGGVELANAAGIVAKQLGVWGETGTTAADVANLLAQAANASTVDVEELANGLANAQGTAKTAGVSYNELVQTMALLAPNFASASTAGTSLNNFLIRLQPATTAAADAMDALGLITEDGKSVFYDAQGNFIGMAAAADELQMATKYLTDAEKTQYLQTIFGNDAMGAAVTLANAGSTGFNNMGAAMLAAGTASEQAAAKNQGFKFALDSMLGSIETLQIIVGSHLLPVLTNLINTALIPAVNVVSAFATALTTSDAPLVTLQTMVNAIVPNLGTFLAALVAIGVNGVTFYDFVDQLPAPLALLAEGIAAVSNLIAANWQPILLAVATVLGVVVVAAIGSAIASLAALIAPVVAAVAIVAAMYAAYNTNFLGIQTLVNSVMSGIMAVITSVMSAVMAFWDANGAQIMASTSATWTQLQATISTLITAISAVVTTVFTAIAGFIDAHGAQIGAVLSAAWQFIMGMIEAALQVIQGIVQAVTGVITGDWDLFGKGMGNIADGFMKELHTIFTSGVDLVKSAMALGISAMTEALKGMASDAISLGRNIIDGVVKGVQNGVGALKDAVASAAQKALDAAKSMLGIHSPSRVFADQVGMMIPAGVALGVQRGTGMALGAVGDMASALTGAAQVGVGTGAVGIGVGAGAARDVAGGTTNTTNYTVNAQYSTVQNERSVRDTIRMMNF